MPAEAPPAPSEPVIKGYGSGKVRARWTAGIALATIAAYLWEIGADAARVRVAGRILAGQPVSLGSVAASDEYVHVTYVVAEIALVVPFLCFLYWLHRAATNAGLFVKDLGFTPAWSVGWFFVPLANIVKPAQIVNEIWQASDGSPASATRIGRSVLRIPMLIPLWWALWLLDVLALGSRLLGLIYTQSNALASIRSAAFIDIGLSVAVIASLLAMIRLVQVLEARQTAKVTVVTPPVVTSARGRVAGRRIGVLSAAASLVAAPLALAFLVSNGTSAAGSHGGVTTPQSSTWQTSNAAQTSCSDPMLQPSGAMEAGLKSTCTHLAVGTSLFAADCTKGAVPANISPAVFDSSGKTTSLGSVTAHNGGCALSTRSTSVTTAVFAGPAGRPTNEPGSVIVVADFIPTSNASGVNTIGVRVHSGSEFAVVLGSGGDYAVIQTNAGAAQALVQGNLKTSRNAALDLTKPVRVVIALHGTAAAVYVDGVLIGAGITTVPDSPGGCGFSLSTSDASKPVVTTLLRLELFAAG